MEFEPSKSNAGRRRRRNRKRGRNSQLTAQSTAKPTARSTAQPNAQPTAQPNAQPTVQPSESTTRPPCFDWVVSTASSHHACRDRAFFIEYTPLPCESSLGHPYLVTATKTPILGIGCVLLGLQRTPEGGGDSPINKIRMEKVLHCPSIAANVFALNVEATNRDLVFNGGKSMRIRESNGTAWGFATLGEHSYIMGRAHGLCGGSGLEHGVMYCLSVNWNADEEYRVLRLIEEKREEERKYLKKLSKRPDALTGGVG